MFKLGLLAEIATLDPGEPRRAGSGNNGSTYNFLYQNIACSVTIQ